MNRFSWLVVYVLGLAAISACVCPGYARTWNYGKGQKVDGDFVKTHEAEVVLLVNGKPMTIKINSLSSADQKYVTEQLVAQKKTVADVDERTWKDAKGHTWKDKNTGKTVLARMMGMEGDKVVLLTSQGQTRFPFKDFSRPDQQFVREEMTARGQGNKVPAQIAQANPQQPKKPKKTTNPKTPKLNPPANTAPSPVPPQAVASNAQPPETTHPEATHVETVHPDTAHPPSEHPAPVQPVTGQAVSTLPAPTSPMPVQQATGKTPASTPVQSLLAHNKPEPKRAVVAAESVPPPPPVKSKVCSACGQKLPNTVKAGDSCPFCGVYLQYENTDQGPPVQVSSAFRSLGAPAGLASLCCVIAVAVFRLRSYAQHN